MTSFSRYISVVWAAQTWREIGYLLLGLPLGILWFTYAVTMYATGASLVIIWVGIPVLLLTHWSMRGIGAFERGLFNRMLGEQVQAPARRSSRKEARRAAMTPRASTSLTWIDDLIHDGSVWRVVAWVSVRGLFGGIGFAAALIGAIVPFAIVAAVVQAVLYQFGIELGIHLDEGDDGGRHAAEVATFWTAVGSPVALLIAPAFAWASRGTAYAHRVLGRWALGPCKEEAVEAATQRAELAEEQVRIDQELHDSIGHMITMNIIQAGAGAHVFDSDPEFARQALKNIEERGRAAMGELDRIIATIRGDKPETRAPLPGLEDIDRLIDESRAAGMEVEALVEPPPASAAVGRAAFTVVREALTNAARHAPGARVNVTICADGDALALLVENGAPAGSPGLASRGTTGGGRGLAGIRDRVTLLGGRAMAAPEGGGFAVRALLPLGASLAPASADDASPWADLREKVKP